MVGVTAGYTDVLWKHWVEAIHLVCRASEKVSQRKHDV